MTRICTLLLVSGVLTFASMDSAAQTADDPRAAYERGRKHYKHGEYAAAVDELQLAYALKPHPALLRYIGDAYFQLNDAQKALESYRQYLVEAPKAADFGKIQRKVKELELVLGVDDQKDRSQDGLSGSGTGTSPPGEGWAKLASTTGDDHEVPAGLAGVGSDGRGGDGRGGGVSAMKVMKWMSAGLAVSGLVLGIIFNRLAAGKADQLKDAVRQSGNEDGRSPMIPFAREHYDLQQDYKLNQTVSLVSFIAGGVAAGAAATFFVLDRGKERPKTKRQRMRRAVRGVSVAPVVGEGLYGVTGQLSF